jgi:hypothetical protein
MIRLFVGPRDRIGKRNVVAKLDGVEVADKFDTDELNRRVAFARLVAKRFGLPDDEWAQIPDQLLLMADAEDARGAAAMKPVVICMDDLPPLNTEWLWEGRIPIGALTIWDGPPGDGKSTASIDLAARISRGDSMPPASAPDGTYKPANVLIMSPEDDPQRTIRPRLDAAGADVRRIHLLRAMNYVDGEGERGIQLPLDVDAIGAAVNRLKARLVIIDPLTCHLDEKTNTNSDASMRQALTPLARMAEVEQCAVQIVRHTNKKEGQSALNRGGGSVGIIGACRAGFAVARDPNNPDQVIMACTKMNLARKPPSLAFEVVDCGDTSRIQWSGAVEITADELLGKPQQTRGASKVDQARDIISEILSEGSRGSNEVEQAINDAGISRTTYWAARKSLNVQAEKSGFNDGQWLLSLPIANGFHHEEFDNQF